MLIVTLGDPFSINIELLHKCRASLTAISQSHAVLFTGSHGHWMHQTKLLGVSTIECRKVSQIDEANEAGFFFLDIDQPGNRSKSAAGLSKVERAELSAKPLEIIKQLHQKSFSSTALLTMPVDKEVVSQAIAGFRGQTDYLETLFNSNATMILAGPKLRVGLVTNHMALAEVSTAITVERVQKKLELFHNGLKTLFHLPNPRIAVCGLNPHCGDHGLFGTEDETIIAKAVATAKDHLKTSLIVGPKPADTVFYQALAGKYDGVLAMYHDQGLGPLKTVHFWDAINVSAGLPVLRVSPDHGPALDLFGKGLANHSSCEVALNFIDAFLQRGKRHA